MNGFCLCQNVRSYINKKYVVMKILSITTVKICIYSVKYPLTIQWGKLKKIGGIVEFKGKPKKGKEWVEILLPMKEVVNLTTSDKLHKFVINYVNF